MKWSEIFYIADIRGMYDESMTGGRDETNSYAVLIRPMDYCPNAEHYQMNSFTSYDKCMELIKKYVTTNESPEAFLDKCMDMSYGFCVQSKAELQARREYYAEFVENTDVYKDDVSAVVEEGSSIRVISGKNVSVTITNVNDEDSRSVAKVEGSQDWVDWCNEFFGVFLCFDGHTKVELYENIKEYIDAELLNEVFGIFKKHGCKSIRAMKRLTEADLWLYLTDFVNELS